MFFTPDENFSASPEEVDEIRRFFGSYNTYGIEDLDSIDTLGTPPDGHTIARTAIIALASASASFRGFSEWAGVEEEETHTPSPIHSVGLDLQDGINKAYQSLTGSIPVGLDGDEIISWIDGEGRPAVRDDISGLAEFLALIHYSMKVLRGTTESMMRPTDDIDGSLFAYVAWEHYMQGILEECQCAYMQAGFEVGIDLGRIPDEIEFIMDRLRSDEKRVATLSNEKPVADEISHEASSDLQDMLGNAGSMMN